MSELETGAGKQIGREENGEVGDTREFWERLWQKHLWVLVGVGQLLKHPNLNAVQDWK